ncbi:MAG: S41 family peptidase [Rufibacter sp.]
MKLKFLKRCLFSLFMLGSYPGFSQTNQTAPEPTRQFTPAQLQEDFRLLYSMLKEGHPGMYRYTSKEKFGHLYDSIALTLDHPMTQQEFFVAATPLIAALKDGHTKWMPRSRKHYQYYYNLDRLFPLELHFTGKQAHLVHNMAAGSTIPLRSEVLAINGLPIAEMVDQLLPKVFFADGNSQAVKYLSLDRFLPFYYGTYIGASNQYEITYKAPESQEISTAKVPAVTLETIQQLEKVREKPKRPPIRVEYKENNTPLLSIDNFNIYKNEMDVEQVMKDIFWQINAKNTQHLIIDLRSNEGGIDKWGALLYSYLTDKRFRYYDSLLVPKKDKFTFEKQIVWLPKEFPIYRRLISKTKGGNYTFRFKKTLREQKPQKNNFKGEVYVLIDGYSFSVTSEFCAIAHYHKRATFIGRETGGGYYGNTSGFFVPAKLPHTNLEVAMPQWDYYMAVSGYPYKDRGILPDYPIEYTADDLIRKRDLDLEKALELIKASKEPSAFKESSKL